VRSFSFSLNQVVDAKNLILENKRKGLTNYVYVLKRLDKNEIFYVGEGAKHRFLQHFYPRNINKAHPKNSILRKLNKPLIQVEFIKGYLNQPLLMQRFQY